MLKQSWNSGDMRRYHHASGAKIVITTSKRNAVIIPASCNHISVPLSRGAAAAMLHDWRNEERGL